jgi:UPI00016EA067 related cluster
MGEMWRTVYESDTFIQDLEALWKQIEPLYKHLHAYVRRKLMEMYGTEKIKKNGPIPAHLLGKFCLVLLLD